jgi:hypothetical protein
MAAGESGCGVIGSISGSIEAWRRKSAGVAAGNNEKRKSLAAA